MRLSPGPDEPPATPYRPVDFSRWLEQLLAPTETPTVIAIDGRGAAGKSTLAERIAGNLPQAAIVHTDDLAWHHSILGWDDLLREHILTPFRRGETIDYRPPGWITHDRSGSIRVPAGVDTLIVEGTGTIRRELTTAFDATVWIQGDYQTLTARGIERDVATGVNGDRAAATEFWEDWQREEVPFLARQRPWELADSIVAGTETVPLSPAEIAVAG